MTVAELYALVGDTSLLNYGKRNPGGPRSPYTYKGDYIYRITPYEGRYHLTVGSGRYQDDWGVSAQPDDEIEVSE